MLETGGDLDLLEEPLRSDDRRELGMQHFHRDLAVMACVGREVDGRHPAAAELALDRVAVGECPFQRFVHDGGREENRHRRDSSRARNTD